jgi:hypothetical protein
MVPGPAGRKIERGPPMLDKLAFANSLAVLTAALYIGFAVIALVSPAAFQLLFNAQFFGADVASLFPKVRPSAASLLTLVIVVVMAWLMGYAWACLYNRFARRV